MTKTEAANHVKSMIKDDFNMTLTELKVEIMKTFNPSTGSDHFKSKNGYSVFYTDNNNYMQGIRNGGGEGYYAVLHGVGVNATIKI